jgi:hypothetical protein
VAAAAPPPRRAGRLDADAKAIMIGQAVGAALAAAVLVKLVP